MATPDTLGVLTGVTIPCTATASSSYSTEPPDNAVDGSASTNWTTNAGGLPCWWKAAFKTARAVYQYSIRRRNDSSTRNVKDFTFQGSNDDSAWTTLDTQTGITWPTADEVKVFTFTNATAYLYYRVNITANNGDASYTSINEIILTDGSSIASLAAWFKADAITGFADGAALTSWVDSSAQINTVNTVAGTAPKYRATGGPLGLPCVDHTVAAGGLNRSTAVGIPRNDYTYFMVVQSGSTAIQSLMNGSAQDITAPGEAQIRLNNLKIELDKSGVKGIKASATGLAANTWTVVIVTFTSVGEIVHFDIGGTVEDYALGGTLTFNANDLSYGNYRGTGNFFNGKMAEIGLYSSVLSSGDLADLKAYLNAKYFAAPTLGTATSANDVGLSASLSATLGLSASTGGDVSLAASLTQTRPVDGALSDDVALSADLTIIPTSAVDLVGAAADDVVLAADLTLAAHLAIGTAATGDDVALAADLTVTLASMVPLGTATLGSDVALAATLNLDLIHLLPWTRDTSQKTLLDIVLTDTELVVNPPLAIAPDGTGGPGPGGTGGPLVVERMLRRQSHVMPVPIPDADGHVRVSAPWAIIDAEVGVLHVFVSGRDITYFRGAPTTVDEWNTAEPFGDVSAQVSFPQLTQWDVPGVGDVAWLHPGASVEIILLDVDGVTRHRRFAGHFISDETGSGEDDISNVWQAEGSLYQADHVGIQVPTILPPTDIGTLIRKTLNAVPSRRFGMPTNTMTGILSRYRGGMDDSPMDYVQTLLGTAWKSDGSNQWTVAKIPNTTRGYEVRPKDRTTAHWTVTAGAPGIELNLSSDLLSTITEVWGHGIGPDGYGWSGMVYPKFLDDDAPPFPFANPAAIITIGTTDADTDSGTGVSTWQRRVNELNLTPDVVVDGVYNSSDAAICLRIQHDYGLLEDAIIGGQTWTATFAVGSSGGDLTGARRRPLAILRTVEQNLHSANGAIIGPNPDYDPKIMRFRRDEDFGTCTKAEATRSAIAELARDKDPGLTGSMTFTTDPHNGSRWLIDEGHNIRVNGYRGRNPLLHVADVRANPETYAVTVNVDEHARDAMTLASIRANARDAAADPARRPGAVDRRSRMEQDITVPFDGESEGGQIPRHAIHGGLWSVIHIPVSQVGRISKIELATQSPAAKFCVAFFSTEVTPAHLTHLVGNPLTGSDPFNKDEAQANTLNALGIIEAFGGPGQAAGYWPRTEDKGAPLTGKFKDGGGMEYVSQLPPWVWIAEWSPVSTFISGRVYPAQVQ